jgi:hypothetical protein
LLLLLIPTADGPKLMSSMLHQVAGAGKFRWCDSSSGARVVPGAPDAAIDHHRPLTGANAHLVIATITTISRVRNCQRALGTIGESEYRACRCGG